MAMLDTETGEVIEKTLQHEGEELRRFYAALPHPVSWESKPLKEGFKVLVEKRKSESPTAMIYGEAIRFGVGERSCQVKSVLPKQTHFLASLQFACFASDNPTID